MALGILNPRADCDAVPGSRRHASQRKLVRDFSSAGERVVHLITPNDEDNKAIMFSLLLARLVQTPIVHVLPER
jgi:hypothetical protein